MKTIVIANSKGGSGKSTLTVHLAVAALLAGDGPVLIADTDPQATAGDWFNQRQRKGEPVTPPLYAPIDLSSPAGTKANIEALGAAGARYLFIDTAPSISQVNANLFSLADLILVPLNPTPADLRALVKGLPLIQKSQRPFSFLLSRVRPNLRSNSGTAVALGSLGLVLGSRMHERVIYAEAFGHGKTALEIEPQGTAAQEMRELWETTKDKILENEKARSEGAALDSPLLRRTSVPIDADPPAN